MAKLKQQRLVGTTVVICQVTTDRTCRRIGRYDEAGSAGSRDATHVPDAKRIVSLEGEAQMVPVNRMRLGRFEFAIDFGSFRRITQSWSGAGWDFSFSGQCINDDPQDATFLWGRVVVYADSAPLPVAKTGDYTGIEIDLPGSYDENTGEPYFAIDVGESYEISDVRLRFAERDGGRYRIELSGTVSAAVLGRPERLELSAWADEHPDHSHLE